MHRKESQQLQRTALLLRRCPQGLNPIVAAATRNPAERYCLPHKALWQLSFIFSLLPYNRDTPIGAIMSSFIVKKHEKKTHIQETGAARTQRRQPSESSQVIGLGRRRIECSGERMWQFEDFDDLPFLESCNRCHFSRGRDYRIKPFIVNYLR